MGNCGNSSGEFLQRSFYMRCFITQKRLHTETLQHKDFKERSFYTHTDGFTQRSLYFPHWALLLLSSLAWPLCVVLCFLVLLLFGGHTHNDTQDVIVHVTLIAGSDPTSLCFVWFGVVWLWLWVFCLLGCFCFGLCFFFSWWDSSLDCVQVHYQCFCGYRQVDSLAW